MVEADRVDVEVVVGRVRVVRRGLVALVERHVVEAVPLEQHPPGRHVDLLDDAVIDLAVARAADGGEVAARLVVGRDQRRALGGQRECVLVRVIAVARVDARDHVVRRVGDDVLALAVARTADAPPCHQVSTGFPCSSGPGQSLATAPAGSGLNQTGRPRSSTIRGPPWSPGRAERSLAPRKIWPGASDGSRRSTVMCGGLRSGKPAAAGELAWADSELSACPVTARTAAAASRSATSAPAPRRVSRWR